ncbi:hypothetical protein L9F63_022809 [Diploptera punctata]|uniref:Uncharacterized protein n=1 Tax=Diploptera punctata TaxID=6984 RepID=A0AAD8EA18_DIPPU|nr:hypothetical protein L9F63_022809 [Diploptera punctata]
MYRSVRLSTDSLRQDSAVGMDSFVGAWTHKGNKLPRSMGPGDTVKCLSYKPQGRSLSTSSCDKNICAQVCEYGFKVDENGCPTCECDDPCVGFPCGPGEECVAVRDENCDGFLCHMYPQCQPFQLEQARPPTNAQVRSSCGDVFGEKLLDLSYSCRIPNISYSAPYGINLKIMFSVCEYLRDFSDKMEGTREGMRLALPPPKCHMGNGLYEATQCDRGECWCVDSFGTEIPGTKTRGPTACEALREELGCLDLTCRLGCDYGFQLDRDTRCPLCECRNPCDGVTCSVGESCQMVEVNCEGEYCPPVPACLPNKPGQCPYLVPVGNGSCDYECRSDLNCNGSEKCCSNGCGTQCIAPVMLTACQHRRAILEHKAHETGIPASQMYLPQCREEDGSFEPVQCHPKSRQCWCVDNKGDELPGTRAPPDVQPSCAGNIPSNCPAFRCAPCPYGYQMDLSGCPTCTCKDLCAEISCYEEGEACRLVEVSCTDQPCPPVPMCLPRRENPCLTGHPLLEPGSTDMVQCGPNGSPCPSSHKCHLSPFGEYAVCCPKPRDVCFEPMDAGTCEDDEPRWYFDSQNNTCSQFKFGGCSGNQNNFDSQETCNAVCPVLSQCERMREKNQKVSEKYKSTTFIPECNPETGEWEPIQCLKQVGVCWCVNRMGEPIKGTITRETAPKCSSRQARRRMHHEPDFDIEELLKEVATLTEEAPRKTRCQALQEKLYAVNCDADGKFLPTQCFPRKFTECWCVDEAGNQLPNTTTFKRGAKICLPTPVEAVEVRLGFLGSHIQISSDMLIAEVRKVLDKLGAKLRNNLIEAETRPDAFYVTLKLSETTK